MSRSFTIAICILVGVIVIYLLWNGTDLFTRHRFDLSQEQIDSLLAQSETRYLNDYATHRKSIRGDAPLDAGIETQRFEVFPFDPNTADTTSLLRLGFPRWMVRAMLKYRAKGGRYAEVEDMQRIPGMTPEIYERLKDYVRIDPKFKPYDRRELYAGQRAKWEEEAREDSALRESYARKLPRGAKLDLNTADSAQLCQVPGIASQRARQILTHRQALGGFVSVSQLSELYDFPDSCQQWFFVQPIEIHKININKATMTALRRHPYIGGYRALAIESFRHNHGVISSIDQLRLAPEFSEEDINRLRPYVTY